MKEATKLRNALMKTLCLKADMTNATAGAEDSVNTRIISPICIMDIAYGIWQEHVLATMNPQGEVKACADVIKRIWSTSISGEPPAYGPGTARRAECTPSPFLLTKSDFSSVQQSACRLVLCCYDSPECS